MAARTENIQSRNNKATMYLLKHMEEQHGATKKAINRKSASSSQWQHSFGKSLNFLASMYFQTEGFGL